MAEYHTRIYALLLFFLLCSKFAVLLVGKKLKQEETEHDCNMQKGFHL